MDTPTTPSAAWKCVRSRRPSSRSWAFPSGAVDRLATPTCHAPWSSSTRRWRAGGGRRRVHSGIASRSAAFKAGSSSRTHHGKWSASLADTKSASLQTPARPTVYIPMAEAFSGGSLAWVVKIHGSVDVAAQVRAAVAAVDSAQRVRQVRTMNDIVARSSARSRFNARLFGVFAGVALLLATLGLYGVLSFLVAHRRQEIGTRMALGASTHDVLRAVLRQGLTLTLARLVHRGRRGAPALALAHQSAVWRDRNRPSSALLPCQSCCLWCRAPPAIFLPAGRPPSIRWRR